MNFAGSPVIENFEQNFSNCCYFDRYNKILIRLSPERIEKQSVENFGCYENSAVGITSQGKIILAGGTKLNGKLTNKVYIISPKDSLITEIDSMPCRMKEGHIFEYKNYYYCIGGTCKTDPNNEESPDEGSEILRYNFDDKRWEVILHHNEKNPLKTSLKDLISPGVFFYDNKAYLVGGKIKMYAKFITTDQVYSINLRNNKFTFLEEKFVMPISLINSFCICIGSTAIISGGFLENGLNNQEIFKIDFSTELVETLKIKIESIKSYPPYYEEGKVIIFGENSLWSLNYNEDIIIEHKFEGILQKNLKKLKTNINKSDNDHIAFNSKLILKSNRNSDLKQKIKSLEAEFDNLKNKNKNLGNEKDEINRKKEKIDEIFSNLGVANFYEIDRLIKEKYHKKSEFETKLTKKLDELDRSKESICLDKRKFKESIQKMSKNLDKLVIQKNKKIDDSKIQIQSLKDKIIILNNQHGNESTVKELENKIKKLEALIKTLETEKDNLIDENNQEIDKLGKQLKEKKDEICEIKNQKQKLMNEKEMYKQEIDEIGDNLSLIRFHIHSHDYYELLKQNFEDLEEEFKIKSNLNNNLKIQEEKLKSKINQLGIIKEDLEENFKRRTNELLEESFKRTNELELRNNEIEKYVQDKDELIENYNEIHENLEDVTEKVKELKNKLKDDKKKGTKDIKNLKLEYDSLKKEFEKTEVYSELDQEISDLKQKNKTLDQNIEDKQKKINKLSERIIKLHQKLKEDERYRTKNQNSFNSKSFEEKKMLAYQMLGRDFNTFFYKVKDIMMTNDENYLFVCNEKLGIN